MYRYWMMVLMFGLLGCGGGGSSTPIDNPSPTYQEPLETNSTSLKQEDGAKISPPMGELNVTNDEKEDATNTLPLASESNSTSDEKGSGALPSPKEFLDLVPLAYAPTGGGSIELPASFDLSSQMPQVGDQGSQNSCVGWAVGYYLKSFQEHNEHQLPYGINADYTHRYSPAFIYNIAKIDSCQSGATLFDALKLLKTTGTPPWEDMPYHQNDCTTTPSKVAIEKAMCGKISNFKRFNTQSVYFLSNLKYFLSRSYPIVVAIELYDDFIYPQKYNNEYFFKELNAKESPTSLSHALLVVGYDESRNAFKIINSWGVHWGNEGYLWIDYEVFRKILIEAFVVEDEVGECEVGGNEVEEVRDDATQPQRFIRDNITEIVTDNNTSLMWQDSQEVSTLRKIWDDAHFYCDNLELGGYSDWHLPSLDELKSVEIAPATYDSTFQHTNGGGIWTSTESENYHGSAWFAEKTFGYWEADQSGDFFVRCVRENQKAAVFPEQGEREAINFSIANHGFLLLSGSNNAQLWEYDAISNAWSQKATLPSKSFLFQSPVFVIDAKAYVVVENEVWCYAQSSNSWERKKDMPGESKRAAFFFAVNGYGYIGGGFYNKENFYRYDPVQDNWTKLNNLNEELGNNISLVSFVIGDKAYLTGTNSNFWEYDATTDTWEQKAYIDATYGQTFMIDNEGYVIDTRGVISRYNVDLDTWSYIMTLDEKICYPVAFSINNRGYVGIGGKFTDNTCTLDITNNLYIISLDFHTEQKVDNNTTKSQAANSIDVNITDNVSRVAGVTLINREWLADTITFTFEFSTNVTGFEINDIVVTNGTKSNFRGSGSTYQVDVIPPIHSNNNITISIASNIAFDNNESGNQAAVAIQEVNTVKGFITTWDTTKEGNSSSNQIQIITNKSYSYNYTVYWGDGESNQSVIGDITHTYKSEGVYVITITGDFPALYFQQSYNNSIGYHAINDNLKLIWVNQWGTQKWKTMNSAFYACKNFNIDADDNPNLNETTDLSYMFMVADKFNSSIDSWDTSNILNMQGLFWDAKVFNQSLNSWDVSNVTNMSYMFHAATAYNQPFSNWNVSSVVDMRWMFSEASSFKQNINNWNVSKVTNMESMFRQAVVFHSDLDSWDVSNVTDMRNMFENCDAFNGRINTWNVSNVRNMSAMFYHMEQFNQDISSWNVSNVSSMKEMFVGMESFNQDLSSWDVSNVINMSGMFGFNRVFNQDISSWDVSKVVDMSEMFYAASSFNKNLNNWNVSNVTSMRKMFYLASSFNQNLNAWDVSNVKDMYGMFGQAIDFNGDITSWNVSKVSNMSSMFEQARLFNQDISNWDTSSVTNMSSMFYLAYTFNQDLSTWNVINVINMEDIFTNSNLSTQNYNKLLTNWGQLGLKPNVSFGANGIKYSPDYADERQYIIDTFGWTINDGGVASK